MKIKNSYAKKVSGKEKPVKDAEGLCIARVFQVAINKDFDTPAVEVHAYLDGEKGGQITQKFYFDLIFTRTQRGFSKLPRTLIKLDLMSEDEANALCEKEELELSEVVPFLQKLKEAEFKFKSVLKDGRFRNDYESIRKLDAEPSLIII